MRVLLATDGSAHAHAAAELAAALRWPDDTLIRVLTVVEPFGAIYGAPWAPALPEHVDRLEAELAVHGQEVLDTTARSLEAGRHVEQRLARGRPASSIVHEATEWQADLVIVGSRGHGGIASMVLGSISAEVVDLAPCPVLVARRSQLRRVVLGHDGSPYALAAEQLLSQWSIFEASSIEVVSVAEAGAPWRSGLGPVTYVEAPDAHDRSVAMSTAHHARVAEESARRLTEAGREATPVVVSGEPATSLVRVAADHHADLVVVGTHGRTGFARVLLGSVARNVMQHAACSVLVARRRTNSAADRAFEAGVGSGPTD